MDYLKLLEHSFEVEKVSRECPPKSHLEYLGDSIFDFTTYDGEMSALFGKKAIEVCAAINNQQTFDYIKDEDNYKWFLLMCNMPFFSGKLDWGTSIRGAWWSPYPSNHFTLSSCGIFDGDEQLTDMKFDATQWRAFIAAMIEFSLNEMESNHS